MGNKNKSVYPWTDINGDSLLDVEIKKRSVSWTADIWEEYLTYLEIPLKESQNANFNKIVNNLDENIFERSQSISSEEIQTILRNAIATLTEMEKQVVELLFFKSKSEREAAKAILVSRTRIQNLKRSSLKKLKSFLHDVSSFPIEKAQTKTKEKINVQNIPESSVEDDSRAG